MTLALKREGSVRVSIRASAGHFHRELDVSLPRDTSLNEVLSEVTELMNAPSISKPWRFSTPAGKNLDHDIALADTAVEDGWLLLLQPHAPTPAPVVRDAAEALADQAPSPHQGAVAVTWSGIGLACLCLVAGVLLGWPQACAGAALCSFGTQLWRRSATALSVITVLCASMSAAFYVEDLQYALVAGALSGLIALGVVHITGLGTARLAGTTFSLTALCLVWALCSFMPGLDVSFAHPWLESSHLAGAAATVGAATIIISVAPGLTTRLAGLSIPQLPTAGEDLAISDIDYAVVERSALRARHLYEGMLLGVSIALFPALLTIALVSHATYYALALCLALLVGALLHAARHKSSYGLWALLAVGAQAAVGVCLLAVFNPNWFTLALAGVVVASMVTCCLWSRFLHELEPTTMVWIERAEALCVMSIIPLAMHLSGVFLWVRGLG